MTQDVSQLTTPGVDHHSTTASRTPALLRFGPLAAAVAGLAAVSMGLITWSHANWGRLQAHTHKVGSLLTSIEQQARTGQLRAEQAILGLDNKARDVTYAQAAMLEAQKEAQELLDESPTNLRPPVHDLQIALALASEGVVGRVRHIPDVDAQELERRLQQVGVAIKTASDAWDTSLKEQTRIQHQLDRANVLLVAVCTVVLLLLMHRAHRQRRIASSALQARDAQLHALTEVMPDLAFRMDATGVFLTAYGSNQSLLGQLPSSLVGQSLFSLFNPSLAGRFKNVLDKALLERTVQHHSFSLLIDNETRYFDSRCAPVGDLQEVVWMIWDQTTHRQTEKRLRHKTRLYDFLSHVNQSVVRSTDVDTLLMRVCEVAVKFGQFKQAWVVEPDARNPLLWHEVTSAGQGIRHAVRHRFELPAQPPGTDLDDALRYGNTFCHSDLSLQRPRLPWVDAAISAGLPGCVTVPLRQDDTLIGHLILLGQRVNDQAEDLVSMFEELGKDLAFALTNLAREARRRQAEERMRLHAAALESTSDGMLVLSAERKIVSVNAAFTHLTGWPESKVIGRTPEFLLIDEHTGVIKEISAALRKTKTWQGELSLQRRTGEQFVTKTSVSVVPGSDGSRPHLVGMFTDITPLKQTEARLAHMAHFDALTELPNRMLIHQRLTHALNLASRHQSMVGVVFIDLDNFKTVNDGLGHAAGDDLLHQVALRLRQRVRQEDTLGRLGGDEFVVVLEHLRHAKQAALVATAILETLNQPFTLAEGQNVYVRASIGIAMYPDDGLDASELIRNADAAMYESKRRGRNHQSFYKAAFTHKASTRLQLETRLRNALAKREFTLVYQPQVTLESQQVTGVEALVRLPLSPDDPPGTSPIGPAEFIPIMEESGMISTLGEWVLTESCRQGKTWLDQGIEFGRVCVNLSPAEMQRGGVVERGQRILQESGLPPRCLELEITESGLMESGSGIEQLLHTLHGLGVTLTIDDFGTGYSSLAYLKRFPVHQIKIDRSFVQDLPGNENDAQLVSAMIAMAHGLRLTVVAEGVEVQEQAAYLNGLGCDLVQGYLYSRPQPASQLGSWLIARSPDKTIHE